MDSAAKSISNRDADIVSLDTESEWDGPRPYKLEYDGVDGHASARGDPAGRFDLSLDLKTSSTHIELPPLLEDDRLTPQDLPSPSPPRLNIAIHIVGSRGDVQPFLALGQELQKSGHRVRIATHDVFESFVLESNLEFYPIGGDPAQLMAYMVKNPGVIPKFKTVRAGEIPKKQKMVYEMLQGLWRSCYSADPKTERPFVADAIIANPPSFAHVHCAQALGIPLHMMFTMPWSATRAFVHPLANITRSNVDPSLTNYLSFGMIETLTWQGLRGVISQWREEFLHLEPIPTAVGPVLLEVLEVPFTYCWSPALVPKPKDWASHIDVCGFFFRQGSPYTPPKELAEFLKGGLAPIYIGFGSIVIDDPDGLTDLILDAVAKCEVRAIVSRGWSKLGSGKSQEDVLFLDDCPHEWLFKNVAAVIHHGGAGTTACGLLNGRPTTIIPFFGDQPFWGNMVASAGAGPAPIPFNEMTCDKLVEAIRFCLNPSALEAAASIACRMQHENGVEEAAKSFHRHLPAPKLQCDLLPTELARWSYCRGNKKDRKELKISDKAASILLEHKMVHERDFHLYQSNRLEIENKRWEPLSASTSTFVHMAINFTSGATGTFTSPIQILRKGGSANEAYRASVKSAGKMTGSVVKGSLVEGPVGMAEGWSNVSALLGEKPRDHGRIDDWKSGAIVGGKFLTHGIKDGLSGFVMDPYRGAKEGGAMGLVKGVAKGSLGVISKPAAGITGLWAYPALGIYRSIKASRGLSKTQAQILEARQAQSAYDMQNSQDADDPALISLVMEGFARLTGVMDA